MVALLEAELDGLVEKVMLDDGVTDMDMEFDSVLEPLFEADVDADADDDGALEAVSEVLPDGDALELAVTSDEEDAGALGDSLLDGGRD